MRSVSAPPPGAVLHAVPGNAQDSRLAVLLIPQSLPLSLGHEHVEQFVVLSEVDSSAITGPAPMGWISASIGSRFLMKFLNTDR